MKRTARSTPEFSQLLRYLGVGVAYYLAGRISLQIALVGAVVTPIWPPTGIALVGLLRYGRKVWPAITLAAFVLNLPVAGSWQAALAIAAGNTAAPLITWWALERSGFDPALRRLRDSLTLVAAGLAGMSVSALIGSASIAFSGVIDRAQLPETAAVWWAGDVSGVLVFAPLLLLIGGPAGRAATETRKGEALVIAAGLILTSPLAFTHSTLPSRYLIFPFVVWAAARFGLVGATVTTLFATGAAVWAAVNGVGPFDEGNLLARMLSLQTFNVSVAVTAFVLAAGSEERRNMLQALQRVTTEMEGTAILRNAELSATQESLTEQIRERDLAQDELRATTVSYLQEHEIAETLQRALLPESLPELEGLTLAARYLPGAAGVEVGGDWYDVFALPAGRVALVVGDVIGRGLKAAGAMGQLRIALRAYAMEISDPATVLDRMSTLLEELRTVDMATVFFGIVDYGNLSFRYASAGHPSPILLEPDGRARFLEGGRRPPLGVQNKGDSSASCDLLPGATLLLYTDGLVETRLRPVDAGMEQLRQLVAGSKLELEELCEMAIQGMIAATEDDVALLGLRTATSLEHDLTFTVPSEPKALPEARRALARWFERIGAGPQAAEDLLLAANEAISNGIEHAFGDRAGSVVVQAEWQDNRVVMSVADNGRWREPRPGDRGRGFKLMAAVLDSLEVHRSAGGTRVLMTRTIDEPWKGSDAALRFVDPPHPERPPLLEELIPVARPTEDIDIITANRIGRELGGVVSRLDLGLVIDFTGVGFVDSSGLRMLFDLAERLARNDQRLAVIAPQGSSVRHLFDLACLETVVAVEGDVERALNSVKRGLG